MVRPTRPRLWGFRLIGTFLYWTVCVVLVVALVAGAAFVVTARRSFPQTAGTLDVPGLHGTVRVLRDGYGVPQIYARDPHDLFLAQGYVQAQDRFWAMDFDRHLSGGRLSELFGAGQVGTDAYLRSMGWHRVAQQEYGMLAPETREALDAFAAGVNAWLTPRHGSELGLEYAVLGLQNHDYRPAAWSPVDSLAWLKVMAYSLRGNDADEVLRSQAAGRVSTARADELFPPYPYDRHRPIVRGGTVRDGAFVPPGQDTSTQGSRVPPSHAVRAALHGSAARQGLADAGHVLATLDRLTGHVTQGLGSNSFAVGGSRTASGKPILENDPHLGPMMPSIWYQVGLHCTVVGASCPYDVAGYAFAELPGVVIGHDQHVAWGFTNLYPDVSDLYLEKVHYTEDAHGLVNGGTYEYRGARVPLTVRHETIRVAGGRAVPMVVLSTRHGPLLSRVMSGLRTAARNAPVAGVPHGRAARPSYAVALRWTALTPGRTADAILTLDRAADFAGFRAAAAQFEVPAQNLVYADTAGHIGYQAPGRIPVRRGYDGHWPAIGWTGKQEWTGYVPFRALPWEFDPPEGYVVTANQPLTEPSYPYHLTDGTDYGYRSQRIADLITGARKPLTVANVSRLTMDTRNDAAATLVPYLLRAHVPGRARGARDLLRGWDFTMPPGSAAAAYFNAVWRHLLSGTFADELPVPDMYAPGSRGFELVRGLLSTPHATWWDNARTKAKETRDDQLSDAMGRAYDELARRLGPDPGRWRWGDLHTLTVTNPSFGTSGIAPVEAAFNRGPLRLGGGDSVVDATAWVHQDDPEAADAAEHAYDVTACPSMRMVVDLADLDRSRWVNLTGASGHAFDRHYFDQAALWARGTTTPMRWGQGSIGRGTADRLTLRPGT